MIFRRKIYQKLLAWKEQTQGTRALLIEGARRIGKSTIVREFARNEYKSYIIIDFNTASEAVRSAFINYISDLDTFFMILSAEYNVELSRRESIIVFDEVQKFPVARQAIKYLVADGRYDYIETGSLISIKENVHDITIPSEERKMLMYPMDFEEFCYALSEDALVEYIRKCFSHEVALEPNLHNKAMFLLRQYILVGGMPQSLAAYLANDRSFEKADIEKRDILRLYRDDIMKIEARYRSKVLAIYDQIPAFLSRSERRVVINEIERGSSFPKYHDTFYWLADSMIVNECFNTTDPNVGLSLNEDRAYVKCYMGDTGLLISHTFDENEIADEQLYKEILLGKLSVNEGMFYENVVSQMLVAAGHKLFFYTKYDDVSHRNEVEIDFILSNNSKLKYKIYPVEVKSSDKYSTKSLIKFNEKFHSRIGRNYVIHPKNLKIDGNTLYIPAYMTFCL